MNSDNRSAQPTASDTRTPGLWWGLSHAGERTPRRRAEAGPSRLTRAAGLADPATPFESLEQRQLLAVLTIPASSVDPATGLGFVQTWFDYVSPYLFKQIPDASGTPETTTEEFDDEMDFWAQLNPSVPPNGTFLNTSGFRIVYSAQADNAAVLLPEGFPGTAGPGDMMNDRDLDVALQNTDQFGIEFFSADQGQGNPVKRITTNARVTVRTGPSYANRGDGDAIKTGTNGTRLELTRDGVVVQTFSGAALAGLLTDLGDGRTILNIQYGPGFDGFRFKAADENNTAAWADQFIIDDISTTYPPGRFAQFIADRLAGAWVTFVGPAGATAHLVDLYGREIETERYLGIQANSPVQIPVADRNDDGVPDLNDGIGLITLTGTNENSSFTIVGAKPSTFDATAGLVPPAFLDNLNGNLDDFEQMAGFGFALTNAQPPQVIGLPNSFGTFLLGSPIVRNNSSAAAYLNTDALAQIVPANFNRANQGVVVNGSIGTLNLPGIAFGSTIVHGSIGRYSSGVQLGSVTIDGDAGYFGVATDAGVWQRDDLAAAQQSTSAQLIIGRTVREISIGARMVMSVQVLGDINNPSRPPLSFINYAEREVVYAINPAVQPPAGTIFGATLNRFGPGQAVFFGASTFRNDTLQSAEYVGYNGTAVRIAGALGAQDPANSEDFTDVYAFAADPTREVVVQGDAAGLLRGGYVRIVDRNGLTVAAFDQGAAGRGPDGKYGAGNVIRFRPDHADVYYLVLNLAPDGGFAVGATYDITLAGMAPTTLGGLTTGAGVGAPANMLPVGPTPGQFVLTLNAGSLGSLRVGMGLTDGMAALTSPAPLINTGASDDDLLDFGLASINIPNDLFSVTAGSDVMGATLLVGRNLGTLITGTSPVAGISNQDGDLTAADIRVGGNIGTLQVSGAVGANQDPDPDSLMGQVSIRSGTRGGTGNIGQILVGAYIIGSNMTVETSPGSVIDQFLVQDGPATQFPAYQIRQNIPRFTTGVGSDIRFADFGLIQRPSDPNLRIVLNYNQSYNFIDDAGAQFTVRITGGDPTNNTSFLEAFSLPVDGSQGVALARLDVTLRQGANLTITATSTQAAGESGATISIGRIRILESDPTSQVLITDAPGVQAEIDVWRIESANPLDRISNSTIGRNSRAGDLVAVDVDGLNRLDVLGNLGLTETHGGPRLLGPFIGIAGADGGVGGPFGVPHAAVDRGFVGGEGDDWDGTGIFVPVQATNYASPNPLEDLGSPVDPYLNGLVVRNGDLLSVTTGAAMGDVVVAAGDLLAAVANSDGLRPFGAFEGIIGSVYANNILRIDVGDGLRGAGVSPFAAAGIFANDEIAFVNVTRLSGAVIDGVILAADIDNAPRTTMGSDANQTVIQNVSGVPRAFRGLGDVTITDATINGAFIQSSALDDWWKSLRVRDVDYTTGNVDSVTLVRTDLFRSEIVGSIVGTVSVSGGAFDSTTIDAIENIALVTADLYRNSTLLGRPTEVHANMISSSRNIGSIVTTGLVGDMSDLVIDVIGTVTGNIGAGNLVRMSINVDNVINSLTATTDIRGTSIVTGRITSMTVGRDLKNTSLDVAGPVENVTVGNQIVGLTLLSSGPDGRIGTFRAQGNIQATISSSGPIQAIESVNGDVTGTITTTDVDGNIGTLRAGRDLLVDALFTGSATTISAGRHIGRKADLDDHALDIRGNLGDITAGGQIYSDLLVGQAITGTVTIGRVSSKPNNDQVGSGDIKAFGRINAVVVDGDINGNITSYSDGIGTVTINNGSLRHGKTITALDGSIDRITITGGDLLGNVYTDGDLTLLELLTGANNYASHIGISRYKSTANSVPGDSTRNELPPGTVRTDGADGARIYAGHDIGRIHLQSGSIYESTIIAGRVIHEITLDRGSIRNDELSVQQANFILAGDRIDTISVPRGSSDNINIVAGLVSLGDDNAVGGIGSAADTIKQGSIGSVLFNGKKNKDIHITAGIEAGPDGQYNTGDELLANGVSPIDSVRVRAAKKSSVYADGPIGSVSGPSGFVRVQNGHGLQPANPDLFQGTRPPGSVVITPGVVFSFTSPFNQKAQVLFNGPGNAYYDSANNRIVLLDTTLESSLTVQGRKNGRNNSNAQLKDFLIVGSNNASLGTLILRVFLKRDSNVFIDGDIGRINANRADISGVLGAGGDITDFGVTRLDSGTLLGRDVTTLGVSGRFPGGAARFLSLGSLNVSNTFGGAVSADQGIGAVTLAAGNQGEIRSGGDIGPVTANSLTGVIISARDNIGPVTVSGGVDDSAIYAGVDLGQDANFGGAGVNADVVSNGDVASVTVGGGFTRSDVSGGVYRGVDGFLGTSDDVASDGRSTVGPVTIGLRNLGSSINSEQYRVISTGSVGQVIAQGSNVVVAGNFAVRELGALPVPVAVTSVSVFEDSRIYRARIAFNQPIDASTLGPALTIAEVRNSGSLLVGLAQGTDYTIQYDAATNIATITFSRTVTDRNLPQQPGVPGPGLFRFILSGAIFRGASQGVMLDGNGDGATGDDYSFDAVVGDAGDKITAGANNLPDGARIDFYPAVDLDLLLDSNFNSDNAPDTNTKLRVSGTIGDHPDANSNDFRAGGDVDLYRVSLRAGQVLILGQMGGNARGALRQVFDATGARVDLGGAALTILPAAAPTDLQSTPEAQFLVNITGTYYIGVAATFDGVDITDPTNIPSNDPVAGAVGAYAFDTTIFDDGNTGFAGDTDSGDGTLIVNAPLPIIFAGADGTFGTADDLGSFTTGRYKFTLDKGPDGIANTRDDVVSGTDGAEVTSSRRSGADGAWGTSDDEVLSVANSAIGLPGAVGVPSEIAPDADVYRLNGGQPILPGTRVRLTMRLSQTAGNIGLTPVQDALGGISGLSTDLLGDVQFALFEMPAGTGFSDAKLVAAPSEFLPIGGQPASTTTDGVNSYGYDANGDFFMDLVLPGGQDVNSVNTPATYAVYVQGAVRSDYTLEVLTQGTGTVQRSRQNVLLETHGGRIDWLEAAGVTTQIGAFDASVLGFAGQINGVDVNEYIIDSLIDNLNAIFTAADVDISVTDDASAFEGAAFSTVFLAGNTEPNAFFNNGTFGASEHVDVFNVDKSDQGVVFLPSLAQLGNDPSQAGVDNLVRALTAAVGRRIGELIGLRFTTSSAPSAAVPIMSANSVTNNPGPGGVYTFDNNNDPISGFNDPAFKTNFFLGVQNSFQLMQRILNRRA